MAIRTRCLSQIGLAPACVVPERWVDAPGQRRRVDFAVERPGLQPVALEVDGYDKTGTGAGWTSLEFQDFLSRQNLLVNLGWRVIRFAIVVVRDDPERCRADLLSALTAGLPRLVPRPHDPPYRGDICPVHLELVEEVVRLERRPVMFYRPGRAGSLRQIWTLEDVCAVPAEWYCYVKPAGSVALTWDDTPSVQRTGRP